MWGMRLIFNKKFIPVKFIIFDNLASDEVAEFMFDSVYKMIANATINDSILWQIVYFYPDFMMCCGDYGFIIKSYWDEDDK